LAAPAAGQQWVFVTTWSTAPRPNRQAFHIFLNSFVDHVFGAVFVACCGCLSSLDGISSSLYRLRGVRPHPHARPYRRVFQFLYMSVVAAAVFLQYLWILKGSMLAKSLRMLIGRWTSLWPANHPATGGLCLPLAAYQRLGVQVPLETLPWDFEYPSFAYIRYLSSLTGAPLVLGPCVRKSPSLSSRPSLGLAKSSSDCSLSFSPSSNMSWSYQLQNINQSFDRIANW
jgi:hypothetical protein